MSGAKRGRSIPLLLIIMISCSLIQAKNIVIFLEGSGSVGKTSLCEALRKHDPMWELIEEDALYCDRVVQFYKQVFPRECVSLESAIAHENIFHAVQRDQILFKESATAQEKTDALVALYSVRLQLDQLLVSNQEIKTKWDNLKICSIDDVKASVKQGSHIIIDTIGFIKPEDCEAAGYKVVRILAYSSLPHIIDRTIARNANALLRRNLLPMRYYTHLLDSFATRYDFEEESDHAIATITREEVNNALDLVELVLPARPNICCTARAELSQKQLHEFRANLMKRFIKKDILYVVPKGKIDFCIKTDEGDLLHAIQQFLVAVDAATQD